MSKPIDNAGRCLNKPKPPTHEEIDALIGHITELREAIAELKKLPDCQENADITQSIQEELKTQEAKLLAAIPKEKFDLIFGLAENRTPKTSDWSVVKRGKRSRRDSGSSIESQPVSTS